MLYKNLKVCKTALACYKEPRYFFKAKNRSQKPRDSVPLNSKSWERFKISKDVLSSFVVVNPETTVTKCRLFFYPDDWKCRQKRNKADNYAKNTDKNNTDEKHRQK